MTAKRKGGNARREWLRRQRNLAAAKGLTLDQLRAIQPELDRNNAAFRPAFVAERATYSPWPQTLDELRARCREFGDAAVAECQWSCIQSWLFQADAHDLSNPIEVARTAVSLAQERARVALNLPHYEGREWPRPIYDRISAESQQEANHVAIATVCDWGKAGRPFFGAAKIKAQYQLVTSSPAWRAAYPPKVSNKENNDTLN